MIVNLILWNVIIIDLLLFNIVWYYIISFILLDILWLINVLLIICLLIIITTYNSILTMLGNWITHYISFTNSVLNTLIIHCLFILISNLLICYYRKWWRRLLIKLFGNFISHSRAFHSRYYIWRCFFWLWYSNTFRHSTFFLYIFNCKVINIMVWLDCTWKYQLLPDITKMFFLSSSSSNYCFTCSAQ